MVLPRVCSSFGRSFLVRGSPRITRTAFLSARIAASTIPQRQFTSSTWKFQEIPQSDAAISDSRQQDRIVDSSRNARSVIVKQLRKRVTPAQVEKLFEDAGLKIESLKMKLNRFTFYSDTQAYVTLANEEQVQQAIAKLDKSAAFKEPIYVEQIKPDFSWARRINRDDLGHMVPANPDGIAQAITPIMEQRRIRFSVLPPGWAHLKQKIRERNSQNREVVIRNLSKYGLEAVGDASVNWGDLKQLPRFLMFVDFSTKEGAEQAIRELDGTEMEGRRVNLELSTLAAHKAYSIGQLDGAALKALQEKGLAPEVDLSKDFDQFDGKNPRGRI